MTWEELLLFLHELKRNNDRRLKDNVTLCDSEGEFYQCYIMEYIGDDILDDKALFFMINEGD